MPPKPHPLDDFISHAAFCHLAPGAQIPAMIEASARRVGREDREGPRSQRDDGDERIAPAPRRSIGRRLATLTATLRLPLPRVNIRATYATVVRKAVTIITFAWRSRNRRTRLDPAVGVLRNTGLFMRPPAPCWREDDAGRVESQLMPATVAITDPSQRQ